MGAERSAGGAGLRLDPYRYGFDNPVSFTDEDGRQEEVHNHNPDGTVNSDGNGTPLSSVAVHAGLPALNMAQATSVNNSYSFVGAVPLAGATVAEGTGLVAAGTALAVPTIVGAEFYGVYKVMDLVIPPNSSIYDGYANFEEWNLSRRPESTGVMPNLGFIPRSVGAVIGAGAMLMALNPPIPSAEDLPWNKGESPGVDWTWKGNPNYAPGTTNKGNWNNSKTKQQLNPDLDHALPKGPHWGLTQPNDEEWDIFPDGRVIQNK